MRNDDSCIPLIVIVFLFILWVVYTFKTYY